MPTAIRTLEGALSLAGRHTGTHWPNPWWPNGKPTFNDCAAMVSWALYGLNRGAPYITYVPSFMDLAQREKRWSTGRSGIRRGDVVIFDWHARGSRDHVGIALGEPKNGAVTVRQTNNGGQTDALRDISYPDRFILGYYRPPYKASQPPDIAKGCDLVVDGVFGPQTVRCLQRRLDVFVDGIFGPQTKEALQAFLGVPVDAFIGPVTVEALQRRVGAVVDETWGEKTTEALQRALNAGKF